MRGLLTLIILFTSFLVAADPAFVQRKDVQQFIHEMVKQYHFNTQEVTQTMHQVQIQPSVIERMEKPYEKKSWDVYKQLFLTHQRLQGGIEFWETNRGSLIKAEQQYGVPANIIVAIIGIETRYGLKQGEYRVLDALATLAFNYPKRSAFFKKELREYLLLCREQHVSPDQYLGSYAGAIGKPQFMPSSYRYYGANFSKHSKIDLINDDTAVIASVANYLHKHGWTADRRIVQPVEVEGEHYKKINTQHKQASYHLDQLLAAGVKPLKSIANNPPSKVGLIELTTTTGQEFWLAYPNFYVITRYNTSALYAIAVYLLSQQLEQQWAIMSANNKYA